MGRRLYVGRFGDAGHVMTRIVLKLDEFITRE